MGQWIWLPSDKYSQQECITSPHAGKSNDAFCIAEFRRKYSFDKGIDFLRLKTGGDTAFRLILNGEIIENGPVCVGGDFLCVGVAPYFYTQDYTVKVGGNELDFESFVQLGPSAICDFSCGHGGFFLVCEVHFTDGSISTVGTDESWLCRLDRRRPSPLVFDGSSASDEFVFAELDTTSRPLKKAEIPLMTERKVLPQGNNSVCVAPNESVTEKFIFDSIYAAYLCIDTSGAAEISAHWYELPEQENEEDTYKLKFGEKTSFTALRYKSVGGVTLEIKNSGTSPVTVAVSIRETFFPISTEGNFTSSDEGLNRVYSLCKKTLRICRQSIHLDSPKHQEPLACTGDYLIETMMTAFTYGDMRLARMDVKRTADWLVENNGGMFHTSYSLLWVEMLKAVYDFTADRELLEYCRPALDLLFERFSDYTGKNGLLERAPNYMFLDWLSAEGYSLHHPPKSLGQTALCMFYYGALGMGEDIYRTLGDLSESEQLHQRAEELRFAVNSLLYDSDRQMYIDGLSTPNEVPENEWLPKNFETKHFSKHSNVLAALYGICDEPKALLIRALDDNSLQDLQPYFMHFVLNAVAKCGLFEQYGLPILERYKELERECDKGLKEGWIAPPNYGFDHSHAWGGTPAYQLPCRFLGLKMIKPGFEEIELAPELFGLDFADISVPTPFGMLRCSMKRGKEPMLDVPSEIKYTVK